jgi:hypothetical protein
MRQRVQYLTARALNGINKILLGYIKKYYYLCLNKNQ